MPRHGRQHPLPQMQPVFHTGERQHVSTAGSLTPSCGFAAQRLRSANPFFRSSPPSMPHYHAAGGRRSIARYARASGGQGYVQHGSTTQRFEWLCCRTVLIALRETCMFTTARTATSVAANAARVPHGPNAACIHGWLAYAFVRLCRPKAPLREPFLPLLAPLHAALPCGGGSSLHSSLRSRLRRSRLCSTRFHNTAF